MSQRDQLTSFYTSFSALQHQTAKSIEQKSEPRTVQNLLSDLKKLLIDANADGFLPTYDKRSFESQLNTLTSQVETYTSSLKPPKQKFSFAKKNPAIKRSVPTPAAGSPPPSIQPPTSAVSEEQTGTLVSSQSDLYVSPSSSMAGGAATLSKLSRCIINLTTLASSSSSSLTAVHGESLSHSVLLLGKVEGSVILHNLTSCLVVGEAWQFRIHTSHQTTFLINTTSTPIIESSSSLLFGPSVPPGPGAVSMINTPPLDFSHIDPSSPSPNWSTAEVATVTSQESTLAKFLDEVLVVEEKVDVKKWLGEFGVVGAQ